MLVSATECSDIRITDGSFRAFVVTSKDKQDV